MSTHAYLHVAVDDAVRVQVVERVHELLCDLTHFALGQVAVVLEDLEEFSLGELADVTRAGGRTSVTTQNSWAVSKESRRRMMFSW